MIARVLGFTLLLSAGMAHAASICEQKQCMAVVDAGSTGSRVHLYSYDTDNTNTAVNIKEVWNNKIRPGLDGLDPRPEPVGLYLNSLMADLPAQNIPVYFYATGGMRLLPQPKQQAIYQSINQWFTSQNQWTLKDIKTITGKQEGVFDWLAVNYRAGTLNGLQAESAAVMDMGGASVQVIIPVSHPEFVEIKNKVTLNVYGREINLFVYSFLGLGQTEVTHQFLDSSSCFSNDYPLPDGTVGAGNAQSCEKEMKTLMNGVHHVRQIVQPILRKNMPKRWYALGGVTNLAADNVFNFPVNTFDNQDLITQANDETCTQSWDSLSTANPGNDYIYGYCLFSSYYYALMVDGYGISPNQDINYFNPKDSVDWTLGVVLHPDAATA